MMGGAGGVGGMGGMGGGMMSSSVPESGESIIQKPYSGQNSNDSGIFEVQVTEENVAGSGNTIGPYGVDVTA